MSAHRVCAWHPWRAEEDAGSPETGVINGDELPCGFWGLNLGPLKEKPVRIIAEPSLRSPTILKFINCFIAPLRKGKRRLLNPQSKKKKKFCFFKSEMNV